VFETVLPDVRITSTLTGTARTLWSDDRGPILVTIAAGWFLSMGVRMILPVLLPELWTAFGMSLSRAGFLVSAVFVTHAIGQLPGGLLSDRIGEGRIMIVSTALSGSATYSSSPRTPSYCCFSRSGCSGSRRGRTQ